MVGSTLQDNPKFSAKDHHHQQPSQGEAPATATSNTNSNKGRFPYSTKFILDLLEKIGFMSSYEFKKKWHNDLMKIYCTLFHIFMIICIISYNLSVTTRSIRYLPEFYQRLMEHISFVLF